jgi:hypothetical protein
MEKPPRATAAAFFSPGHPPICGLAATARAFLAEKAPDLSILELDCSTATVDLAAGIAKTLSLKVDGKAPEAPQP